MKQNTNYIDITGLIRDAKIMKGEIVRVYFTSEGIRETLSISNGDESFQFIVPFAPVAKLIKATRKNTDGGHQ